MHVESPLPLADLTRPALGPPTGGHAANRVVRVDANSSYGPEEPAIHFLGNQGQGHQKHQEVGSLHSGINETHFYYNVNFGVF